MKDVHCAFRDTSCLRIGIFVFATIVVLGIIMRKKVEENYVSNEKAALNAFSWCTAIIEGATNKYGYAISGDQLSAIRVNLNKEMKLSDLKETLHFSADVNLPLADGRGREFTVIIHNERIDEDLIHYYQVDLNYLSYTVFGGMRSHSRGAFFSTRVNE